MQAVLRLQTKDLPLVIPAVAQQHRSAAGELILIDPIPGHLPREIHLRWRRAALAERNHEQVGLTRPHRALRALPPLGRGGRKARASRYEHRHAGRAHGHRVQLIAARVVDAQLELVGKCLLGNPLFLRQGRQLIKANALTGAHHSHTYAGTAAQPALARHPVHIRNHCLGRERGRKGRNDFGHGKHVIRADSKGRIGHQRRRGHTHALLVQLRLDIGAMGTDKAQAAIGIAVGHAQGNAARASGLRNHGIAQPVLSVGHLFNAVPSGCRVREVARVAVGDPGPRATECTAHLAIAPAAGVVADQVQLRRGANQHTPIPAFQIGLLGPQLHDGGTAHRGDAVGASIAQHAAFGGVGHMGKRRPPRKVRKSILHRPHLVARCAALLHAQLHRRLPIEGLARHPAIEGIEQLSHAAPPCTAESHSPLGRPHSLPWLPS